MVRLLPLSVLSAALWLGWAATEAAAQSGPLRIPPFTPAAEAGRFSEREGERPPCATLPSAGREALFSALRRITSEFRQLPIMSPPPGVEIRAERHVHCPPGGSPAQADLSLYMYHPDRERAGGHFQGHVYVGVNPRPESFGQRHFVDEHGATFLLPAIPIPASGRQVIGELHLQRQLDVLITGNVRPFWVPVSRERVLRFRIAELGRGVTTAAASSGSPLEAWLQAAPQRERDRQATYRALEGTIPAAELAKLREQMEAVEVQVTEQMRRDDPSLRAGAADARSSLSARLAALESELAAMSPAERQSPAWIRWSHESLSGLAPAGAPGARMLVAANPAFYDRSLPASSVQALLVRFQSTRNPYLLGLYGGLYQALDWQALVSVLDASRR